MFQSNRNQILFFLFANLLAFVMAALALVLLIFIGYSWQENFITYLLLLAVGIISGIRAYFYYKKVKTLDE